MYFHLISISFICSKVSNLVRKKLTSQRLYLGIGKEIPLNIPMYFFIKQSRIKSILKHAAYILPITMKTQLQKKHQPKSNHSKNRNK